MDIEEKIGSGCKRMVTRNPSHKVAALSGSLRLTLLRLKETRCGAVVTSVEDSRPK